MCPGLRYGPGGPTINGWGDLIGGYRCYLVAAGRSPATVRLRIDQLRYAARCLGRHPGELSTGDLIGWLAALPWKRETRRSYRSALRGLFGWAHGSGRLPTDPAAGLPTVRQPRPVPHPAPEDVVLRAYRSASPRVVLMLELAAVAGLRRGEIAAVRTDDVFRAADGPWLVVRGKGGKDRVVPIPECVAARVAAAPPGWLFANRAGGHVSAGWVGTVCSDVLAGGFTLHSLRHRFATMAYRGSRDLRAVQELLGHASPVTTQRYTLVTASELRAAADAAGR